MHMIWLISAAAFAATFAGGLLALRLKDRLHLILGFSAGAVLGVAFFELIPESLELGEVAGVDVDGIGILIALGFITYLFLDRFVLLHSHALEEAHDHEHSHPLRGSFGAGSLSFHSFLDGIAIGLAFQVSTEVGLLVTAAVLAHDFSDGVNTVSLIIKSGGDRSRALKWLLIDAAAPVIGIAATFFLPISEGLLAPLLAVFSGFFLYIGAAELLPESHHSHPVYWTTIATALGMGVLFIVTQFMHP